VTPEELIAINKLNLKQDMFGGWFAFDKNLAYVSPSFDDLPALNSYLEKYASTIRATLGVRNVHI
jgi:hypothetical protein